MFTKKEKDMKKMKNSKRSTTKRFRGSWTERDSLSFI